MSCAQHVKKILFVILFVPMILWSEASLKDSPVEGAPEMSPVESSTEKGQEPLPTPKETQEQPSNQRSEDLAEPGPPLIKKPQLAKRRPNSYKPYLWIDCQKKNGVFQKKCFTQIKLLTRRMLESGEFAAVRSLSHLSWFYTKKESYSFVSFEKFPPYENFKMKSYAMRIYHSDLVELADSTGRYALIWVEHLPGRKAADIAPNDRREWREMLDLYHLKSSFAHEASFAKEVRGFYPRLGVLQVEGVGLTAEDPAFWAYFYRLERRLYKISGIKRLYSPRHTLRSLSLSLSIPTKKRENLAEILSLWELAGEYGSLRLNPETGGYEIAIFGLGGKDLQKEIGKSLQGFTQSSPLKWRFIPEEGDSFSGH